VRYIDFTIDSYYPEETMKSRFIPWGGFLAAILLMGTMSAYAAEYTEEYFKTFPLQDGGTVRVENVNGKVEISAWDEKIAEVRAVKRTRKGRDELSRATIEVNTANGLEIRTVYQKRNTGEDTFISRMFGSVRTNPQVSVDYTIRIPRTAPLTRVVTVNGSIILRETHGSTVINTTNGTISADGVDLIEKAETTNGDVSLSGTMVRSARTVNGSISARVSADIPDAMDFSTVNGSVSLALPPGANANVELKTVNGRISVPDGLTLGQGTISTRRVSGKLGTGGRTISAETINGSISLKKGALE
jgi:DUF4097 and DUF4098 domain-containing protein YvlB